MKTISRTAAGWSWVGIVLMAGLGGCALDGEGGGRWTGLDGEGPWWMQATAMTADGRLSLADKVWWPRAQGLAVGESFEVDAEGATAGRMLVRRERFPVRSGKEIEGIVWVIDDDGDGSLALGGDRDSDCYVVDYGGDGSVDRILDYIDDDGDGDPDEMDIRYFVDGRLSYCWFGVDVDDDGAMWSLAGYEYGGPSFFEADPYGDGMIYMNKFDPGRGTWSPISECPFAFYDRDGDGYSEEVVRISAVPLDYDRERYPDYANSQYAGPWQAEMERMGIVNIRHSFDVDGMSGPAWPLHYDYGFNLVGAEPYTVRGMDHFNPRRRWPQVTKVVPFEGLRAYSAGYPARETGFSWREHEDGTIAIGYGPHRELDHRWEGVFWIWERRFMENTGGPNQKWNMRREWRGKPSKERRLYYSGVDGRLHLEGAREGWLEIGHFGGVGAVGEVRMFDTDASGYFDRWEVCLGDGVVPARVTRVADEKVTVLGRFDADKVEAFYREKVLPEARAANERLMAAMGAVHPYDVAPALAEAMGSGTASERRYAQDVVRELQYQELRQAWTARAQAVLAGAGVNDLRKKAPGQRETGENSQTAWRVLGQLAVLDEAYGAGDWERAETVLRELGDLGADLGR